MVSLKGVIRFIYCNFFAFSCDSLLITGLLLGFLCFQAFLCPKVISCVLCGDAVGGQCKHCSRTVSRDFSCLGNCVPYIYIYIYVCFPLCLHAHVSFSDLEYQKYPSAWKDSPSMCGFLETPLFASAELWPLSARAVPQAVFPHGLT